MKIFIDDFEYEILDNVLSKKQQKERKEFIRKWIEEVVMPIVDKSKGGKIWCSYPYKKDKVAR